MRCEQKEEGRDWEEGGQVGWREGEAAGEGEEEVGGTGCGGGCFRAVLAISSVVGPSVIVPLVMV